MLSYALHPIQGYPPGTVVQLAPAASSAVSRLDFRNSDDSTIIECARDTVLFFARTRTHIENGLDVYLYGPAAGRKAGDDELDFLYFIRRVSGGGQTRLHRGSPA